MLMINSPHSMICGQRGGCGDWVGAITNVGIRNKVLRVETFLHPKGISFSYAHLICWRYHPLEGLEG